MVHGVRSRRLANVVASAAPAISDDLDEELRIWLNTLTVTQWHDRFAASPTEVADLLSYVRARRTHVLTTLLNGAAVDLSVDPATLFSPADGPGQITRQSNHASAPIQIRSLSGDVLGTVTPADHSDAELILATGLPIDPIMHSFEDTPHVSIVLSPSTTS